jgi:hypothetical protein
MRIRLQDGEEKAKKKEKEERNDEEKGRERRENQLQQKEAVIKSVACMCDAIVVKAPVLPLNQISCNGRQNRHHFFVDL